MCPLHYAAHYTTSKAVVDAIIAEYPEALQAKNNFGETPGVRVPQSLRPPALNPPPLSRHSCSQDTAQSHSKSADVKAVFASADRDGGAGSKARKERRDSGSSTGSLSDRGRLGRRRTDNAHTTPAGQCIGGQRGCGRRAQCPPGARAPSAFYPTAAGPAGRPERWPA